MKKQLLFFLILVSSFASSTLAQTTCGDTFTDPGGPNANYANNTDFTQTICPSSSGDAITVTFTAFSIEANWDALYVFDGNSIAAPQITSTNPAGNVPGGLAGGFWGTTIPGPLTSSSQDGCLTFRFRSDGTINQSGWIANVTCGIPPTCPKPTALTISNVEPTSFVLGWLNNSNATAWEYYIVPAGSPQPTANSTGVVVSVNPIVITGLLPSTCYNVYVRALCSETDWSTWSVAASTCTTALPPGCGGQFFDNGGPNANYAASSDNVYIICPANPGEIVTVVFSAFDTEANWDALYVFDGSSIAAPQIASSNGAGNVPGGLPGGYWGTTIPGPFTSTSPDGCLTFRFRSDPTLNRPGWVANVTCAPDADKIVLVAFVDSNNNGTRDVGENLFPHGNFIYQVNDSGTNIDGYSPSGQFSIYDSEPTNTYDISYQILPEYQAYYAATGNTYSNINIPVGSGPQILYFPVTLTQPYNDVSVVVTGVTAPRPGLTYLNKITYRNTGVTATNGTLAFTKPTPITITNVSQTGTTNNTAGFTYNFTNLSPNETRTIFVTMNVPAVPTVNANDLLTASASITAPSGDINLANNTSTNSQIVVNSWDPNDKMEAHGDKIPINQFTANDYLFYTIRFQNNGTASAIDIRIEDLLDAQLDETSVRMVSASHNYTMTQVDNHLVWEFRNIYLPSSIVSATASTGYVQFQVKVNPGFQLGDLIPNNASIYFDTNPAIVTNTFTTKFINALSTADFDDRNLVMYPNPANNQVQIALANTSEPLQKITFYDVVGKVVKTVTANTNNVTVDVSDLSRGLYMVEISTENHSGTLKKLMIQ
ncbi:DUF7619 domain-containing protein [Flavobacterium sedimenticola]|uniref:T9SS type A sorting domain-containing protein n=1 Tax=Flavobacterium sedimenticola TaxID=3043286 RepID=A0ABT6XN95_9FLAO|nr:T9SS type A sorting domain-containing protein [Flavobacterium sedimenticola]MDI9256488.1 T9SS type A sorting domain-containing protein [Flavobacterium sedimenticola]